MLSLGLATATGGSIPAVTEQPELGSLEIEETGLPGVLLLRPERHGDGRGWFSETWNRARMAKAGLDYDFVQDNQSFSERAGTVRGLHFQHPPHAQAKLVRVVAGAIMDVAVDARRGSPNYGDWVGVELSAENGAQLLVPSGFLHGFVTLRADTAVCYKVDAGYHRALEGTIYFDDPELGIDWGIPTGAAILSEKDGTALRFADFESPFSWGG